MTVRLRPHPDHLDWIERPTLLLDRARAEANIAHMAARAAQAGVQLRPHFKTHQSATVAEWFHAAGVTCATVSSLDMAAYFAVQGWHDLTVAFPCNPRQIGLINALAAQSDLGLLLDAPETLQFLQERLTRSVRVWIEIDAGYGRTGLPWHDADRLGRLAAGIAAGRQTRLAGLLTHAGHSYAARGPAEVAEISNTTIARMQAAQAHVVAAGLPAPPLSIGDTPGCSLNAAFPGIAEIRPGNFVFYDLTQLAIGSCTSEQIAVAVACPVVARYPERGVLVVHGGAVHFSKDRLTLPDGRVIYGQVARWDGQRWGALLPNAYMSGLSQEHGTVSAPAELIEATQIGDLLAIVPVHACLTAHAMGSYRLLDGTLVPMC